MLGIDLHGGGGGIVLCSDLQEGGGVNSIDCGMHNQIVLCSEYTHYLIYHVPLQLIYHVLLAQRL